MKEKKLQAVLFDFDFTLADASVGILQCYRHTFDRFCLPCPPEERLRAMIGVSLPDSFAALTGAPPEQVEQMRQCYVQMSDRIMTANTRWLPGAREVLGRLRAMGLKLGIVSNKYGFRIVEFLEQQSFPMDIVIGSDAPGRHKPAPDPLLLAIERLGVGKDEALYVGDHLIDGQTAQGAGVAFAAVLTGTASREDFAPYEPVAVWERLDGIFDYLE